MSSIATHLNTVSVFFRSKWENGAERFLVLRERSTEGCAKTESFPIGYWVADRPSRLIAG